MALHVQLFYPLDDDPPGKSCYRFTFILFVVVALGRASLRADAHCFVPVTVRVLLSLLPLTEKAVPTAASRFWATYIFLPFGFLQPQAHS